jgi:phosphoribosylformylglycinamidine synthase
MPVTGAVQRFEQRLPVYRDQHRRRMSAPAGAGDADNSPPVDMPNERVAWQTTKMHRDVTTVKGKRSLDLTGLDLEKAASSCSSLRCSGAFFDHHWRPHRGAGMTTATRWSVAIGKRCRPTAHVKNLADYRALPVEAMSMGERTPLAGDQHITSDYGGGGTLHQPAVPIGCCVKPSANWMAAMRQPVRTPPRCLKPSGCGHWAVPHRRVDSGRQGFAVNARGVGRGSTRGSEEVHIPVSLMQFRRFATLAGRARHAGAHNSTP